MTLKQLKYFVAVVEEGSITAAARKLFISQPPLSAQIKSLEEKMGCELLVRGAQKTEPTEAGRALYRHALSLLSLSRIAKDEVSQIGRQAEGTIRIGMVSSIVCSAGARWIEDFLREHPGVYVEITESNTYALLEKLRINLIHLAILRTPFVDENLVCETLYSDTIMAAGRGEFMGEGKTISIQELSEKPVILYRRWEEIVRAWFHKAGLEFRPCLINDDARTTLHFARQGLGVGIIPGSAMELLKDESIVCKEITEQDVVSDIKLAYPKKARLSDTVEAFISHVKKCAQTP